MFQILKLLYLQPEIKVTLQFVTPDSFNCAHHYLRQPNSRLELYDFKLMF
jgi:hypothetical protein